MTSMPTPLYLDHHATTPCDPRVVEAMLPYFSQHFGNPSGRGHSWGMMANSAVTVAREQIAGAIGAQPRELLFTSGATESNNLAIQGLAGHATDRRHLVTVATEHKAVLDPMRRLQDEGFDLTVITPPADGVVTPEHVKAALRPDTLLVSTMWVNNEIGCIAPIRAIADAAHRVGALLHVDAAQALGRVPIDVHADGVDLMSLTAHKVYGPKGVGALFVRAGRPRISLRPLQLGGSQERGLRSGTLSVPLIVGFAQAAVLAEEERADEMPRQQMLRDQLWEGLASLGGVHLHGSLEHRVASNLNLRIDGVSAADLRATLRTIAFSSGSACSSSAPTPSHVLKALGLTDEQAFGAVRFGLGRSTQRAHIDETLDLFTRAIRSLRRT